VSAPASPDPAWVALSLLRHVGGRTMRNLLHSFADDPHQVLCADAAALRRVPGVGPKIAEAIQRIDLHETAQALERWQAAGIRPLTLFDPAYPARLRALDDAPPTLFWYGEWEPPRTPFKAAAVIGTRSPSQQAEAAARKLSWLLADAGYVIVSGLALGIDSAAHLAALPSTTLAVLGSGILNLYPPEKHELAAAVRKHGALLCEVRPDAGVNAAGLVARNRIITGLCEAVVVVETGIDGGAMHAARFARVQNRRLYAVDLPASGNYALLESGAHPVPLEAQNLDWLTA
jgi:DNA processing protein